MLFRSDSNETPSPLVDEHVEKGFSQRGERHGGPIFSIICYVAAIAGVYAPWYLLGTEVVSPASSGRSMWNSGLTDWGSGHSIVVLAVIGVVLSSWRLARPTSSVRRATFPLFLALFVIAARQLLAYGRTPTGWHGRFLTQVIGWGLWLNLVASALGVAGSILWRSALRSPDRNTRRGEEREQSKTPRERRSTNYLCALIVLAIVVVALSRATWLNWQEVTGRVFQFTIRGDSNYGPGAITAVLGLVLLLVCVRQLRTPHSRSPVVPSVLVFANFVTLANFYVAEANPPFVHAEILFHVEWGFFVSVGATLLSVIVLVAWWRLEHLELVGHNAGAIVNVASDSRARPNTTTAQPHPPSE